MSKTKRKHKAVKSLEERMTIVNKIKARFQDDLGIDVDSFEAQGFNEFKFILHEYGTLDILITGFSGKIYVPEFNRSIHYILPLSKHANEHVSLIV